MGTSVDGTRDVECLLARALAALHTRVVVLPPRLCLRAWIDRGYTGHNYTGHNYIGHN